MKALALFFALSLYLLPNPTHSTRNPIRLPTAADVAIASDTPVVDTDGDELRPGETYYIIAAAWGASGGAVKLAKLDRTPVKCPRDVTISSRNDGDPITITPADPNASVVLPSTFLSFKFDVPTNKLCVNKLYWEIQPENYLVKTGEFVSNQSNQFKIEALPNLSAYKITYCPFGTDKCYNVGATIDAWWRTLRLVLTDYPTEVSFEKATT
ncbi:sporamin B-like [Ipomoea triloba]|uniref:sporamin B-like n=1 Tax=Ipomoea triloba TaxID=35885 RepID=UPI00125E2D1B|nr:sporamin B-like [Ipomoea triloba]XP_031118073.1 sporamin B-like [Ipomoea triloba]